MRQHAQHAPHANTRRRTHHLYTITHTCTHTALTFIHTHTHTHNTHTYRNNALLLSLKAVLSQPLPDPELTYECAAALHQLSWIMRLQVSMGLCVSLCVFVFVCVCVCVHIEQDQCPKALYSCHGLCSYRSAWVCACHCVFLCLCLCVYVYVFTYRAGSVSEGFVQLSWIAATVLFWVVYL
jgi:hypothetical protein